MLTLNLAKCILSISSEVQFLEERRRENTYGKSIVNRRTNPSNIWKER